MRFSGQCFLIDVTCLCFDTVGWVARLVRLCSDVKVLQILTGAAIEHRLTCAVVVKRSLWSPYVIGQTIIFLPCDFYLLLSFFSSPNLITLGIGPHSSCYTGDLVDLDICRTLLTYILSVLMQDLENQMDIAEKRRLTLVRDFREL